MFRRFMFLAVIALALVIIAVAMFAWGFFTNRNRVFPYALVRSATHALGIPLREEVRPRAAATDAELLTALGYVHSQYDPDHERRGVLFHDPALAEQGLTFYVCVDHPTAVLMDMSGVVLHEWSSPRRQWHHAELLPSGEVYVVVTDRGVAKLDAKSREIWFFETGAHHDLWVHDDGSVFVLSREKRIVPDIHETRAIVDEKLIQISPDGEKLTEVSLLDVIRESGYSYLLTSVHHLEQGIGDIDILHANHVEVFDGRLSSISPLYQRGNILVSVKHMNSIFIIEPRRRKIVWLWGPSNLTLQHHPTVLENGNILLFDNGLKRSRVIEIEVPSGRIVWT